MPSDPLVRLPDHVTLTLAQVEDVLAALDLALAALAGQGRPEAVAVAGAVHLLTAQLWPELADLLDDGPDPPPRGPGGEPA